MQGMRGELPARGEVRLRAMLRPAGGPLRLLGARRGGDAPPHPGGAGLDLALRRLPPVRQGAAHRARRGGDAAGPRRPARGAARPGRGVGQERHRQPDPLVQGPRRDGCDRQGARARLQGRGLRLDRQPRELGRRARGRGRARVLRVRPVRSRGAEDPRHGRLRHEADRDPRQLRRRQPPLHGALGRARVGVREREHEAVLRRGLEDDRLRDRRAARLGAPRPRGGPDRLRLAVHQDRARLRRVARDRSRRGRST